MDVKSSTCNYFGVENNDRDPKFEIGDHVRAKRYEKPIFKELHSTIHISKLIRRRLVIKQLKNTVQWTYTIKELNVKETAEMFYKKELQKKTNQREFRIKKAIKINDDELYLK